MSAGADVNAATIPEWIWKDMSDKQKQRVIEAYVTGLENVVKISSALATASGGLR
jgi:hypothetical protein